MKHLARMSVHISALILVAPFATSAEEALNVDRAKAEVLYVATEGNDAWAGTLPEASAGKTNGPLATLDAARRIVRQKIAAGLSAPVTVLIRGGEYPLKETVVFTHEDSGTKAFPISYKAYAGETPVFTGGGQAHELEAG